jgi:hypothetical protein
VIIYSFTGKNPRKSDVIIADEGVYHPTFALPRPQKTPSDFSQLLNIFLLTVDNKYVTATR